MKSFHIVLFCLFYTVNICAQPQKGDWYIQDSRLLLHQTTGKTANGNLLTKSNTIGILPEVGRMVDDHLLLGMRLAAFSTKSKNFLTDTTRLSSNTRLGIFGTYYFGSGRVRPFIAQYADISFRHQSGKPVSLGNHFWRAQAGIAFFINKSTELNLTYEVLIQAKLRDEQQWLPDRFRPKFDLGIKQFLLHDRTAGVRPIALDFIKKGVFSAGGDGHFSLTEKLIVFNIRPDIRYFFREGFYAGLRGRYTFIDSRKEFRQSNSAGRYLFLAAPEFGFYLPVLNERIYLTARLNPEFGYDKAGITLVTSSQEDFSDRLSVTTLGLGFEVGAALFIGRHKFTPSVLWRTVRIRPENFPTAAQICNSPVFNLDYELFLSKNFSLNPAFNYFPKQKSVFYRASGNLDNIVVTVVNRSSTSINFGFKWYLRGSNPD